MRLDPTLIVITDRLILSRGSNMPMADAVRAAAAGGATIIQLREKVLGGAEFLRRADELRVALDGSGCAFTVNDRLDVALACGADGVHLGQEDLPLPRAKDAAGGGWLSVSRRASPNGRPGRPGRARTTSGSDRCIPPAVKRAPGLRSAPKGWRRY